MKFLRAIKISTRLFGMFSFIIVCLLFITYSGITSRLELIDDTNDLQNIINQQMRVLVNEFEDETTQRMYIGYLNSTEAVLTKNVTEMQAANQRIIFLVAFGLILAFSLTFIVVRSVVNPIYKLVKVSEEISR